MLTVESLGRGKERRRAKRPWGSRPSYGFICNRMYETFEGGFESNTPKKWVNWSMVPLKSSPRVLLGIAGAINIPRVEGERWGRHVSVRGPSFERELNKGHALTALATHKLQRRGKPTATSFQRLETRRKSNVPRAKYVSPPWRLDRTTWRNTSDNSSVNRREMPGTCRFRAYLNRLVSPM